MGCSVCFLGYSHMHVPQPGPEVATHLKVIALFGITRHTNALGEYDLDVEEIQGISGETQESLYILPRAQLVLLCKQRHLPYSGNKAELEATSVPRSYVCRGR